MQPADEASPSARGPPLERLERAAARLEREVAWHEAEARTKAAELRRLRGRIASMARVGNGSNDVDDGASHDDGNGEGDACARAPDEKRRRGPRTTDPNNRPVPVVRPGQPIVYLCAADGCPRRIQGGTGGFCFRHGDRALRRKRIKRRYYCTVEGCGKQVYRGGFCQRHGTAERVLKPCREDGCENKAVRGGVCIRHGAAVKSQVKKVCLREGCYKRGLRWGVCYKHGAKYYGKVCLWDRCTSRVVGPDGMCLEHMAAKAVEERADKEKANEERERAERLKEKAREGAEEERGGEAASECSEHADEPRPALDRWGERVRSEDDEDLAVCVVAPTPPRWV